MAAKRNRRLVLLVPIGLLLLAGQCLGELRSERRLLFKFDKIDVRGEVDVFLHQGRRVREATVYADKEIIEQVWTRVENKTLIIDANNSVQFGRRLPFLRINAQRVFPVEVIVSIQDLKEIAVTGNGNLSGSGINAGHLKLFSASPGRLDLRQFSADSLEVIQEGAGEIILKGAPLANLNATVNGTGTIRAAELEVRRATIALNGKGHAYIAPNDWLDARIPSEGNLFITRKPERSIIQGGGTGSVKMVFSQEESSIDKNATKPTFRRNAPSFKKQQNE
ncbi:MAG: hypothetical protein CMI26_10285 [Opitutae bacterium]|nr:hypothetical protein [Opitutae bacterium]